MHAYFELTTIILIILTLMHKIAFYRSDVFTNTYIKDIILFMIILMIAYVYCLKFAPSIEKTEDGIYGWIDRLHKKCLLKCDTIISSQKTCKNLLNGRGDSYFINTPQEKQEHIKDCILTFWGFSHFVLYLIIGLILPHIPHEAIIAGIGFELYEYYKYDCHDELDIPLNIAGYFIGRAIRLSL